MLVGVHLCLELRVDLAYVSSLVGVRAKPERAVIVLCVSCIELWPKNGAHPGVQPKEDGVHFAVLWLFMMRTGCLLLDAKSLVETLSDKIAFFCFFFAFFFFNPVGST